MAFKISFKWVSTVDEDLIWRAKLFHGFGAITKKICSPLSFSLDLGTTINHYSWINYYWHVTIFAFLLIFTPVFNVYVTTLILSFFPKITHYNLQCWRMSCKISSPWHRKSVNYFHKHFKYRLNFVCHYEEHEPLAIKHFNDSWRTKSVEKNRRVKIC